MTKTPPNRRGITFEIGAQLEARDSLKNWYAANIEKIDYEEERVLIHYRQWSHRYDEWFEWSSPYLRPVERIKLRKQGLQEEGITPGFRVNEKVLASWSDCRFYPAKVLSVNNNASYTVKFFDGVVQTVKGIHVKPFVKDKKGGKTSLLDKPRGKPPARKEQNEKERKPVENGHVSSENRSDKQQDIKSDPEEEEAQKGDDDSTAAVGEEDEKMIKKEEPDAERICENGHEQGEAEDIKYQEEADGGELSQSDMKDTNHADGTSEEKPSQEDGMVKQPEEATPQRPKARPNNGRRRQRRLLEVGETQREVLELRRRKIRLGQVTPCKRTRREANTDKSPTQESKPTLNNSETDSSTTVSPEVLSNQEAQSTEGQPVVPIMAKEDPMVERALLIRRPAHQPNPNKYSREPLYRVVKNQPPPVLSINLDHNPFKCKVPGCLKSFRKAKLLHYHMKYYHEGDPEADLNLSPTRSIQTRASERQTALPESPRRRCNASLQRTRRTLHPSRTGRLNDRRRRSASSAGRGVNSLRLSLREKQLDKCMSLEERETFISETVEREKLNERKHRDFLRIKLKKRKKKKKRSKSEEDSESDWSTDSLTWSEDELDDELDVITPPQEHDVVLTPKGSEIVRCICEVQEEDDFMIQCEECLCWQHGTCMGMMEDSVPDHYTCYICRDPPGQRRSLRYWQDKDWLGRGHMFGLSFLNENYSDQNSTKIMATHQLLGDVHHVVEVLNSLQLKMNILQSQSHPDLKLWRQPWRKVEKTRRKGGLDLGPLPPPVPDECQERERNRVPSFQDSYISSEHCYQKPRTYYPAVEQRLVVETRDSELEDSLRSTEDLLALEHRYGGPLDPDRGKIYPSLQLERKKADCCKKLCVENGCELKVQSAEAGQVDSSLQLQWQMNLLDHIEAVQEEVTHRMDFIERELDVLESWLDYTGELEPPDPLARLPQLKQRVKHLLAELGKVQQIALCCST